ncbi:MAG: GntR family transcriptional regulator [Gammaproteobacteria bacterium]|nr:GntR family transcriptional regulator [Gammaproteobacteria bacterium]
MNMYSIKTDSGMPIYRQLVDQIREMMAIGVLSAGDALPSVRAVARALGVNPAAVSKAYALLAQDGLVAGDPNEAMVVTDKNVDRTEAMRPQVRKLVDAARRLGISWEDLTGAVARTWEEAGAPPPARGANDRRLNACPAKPRRTS